MDYGINRGTRHNDIQILGGGWICMQSIHTAERYQMHLLRTLWVTAVSAHAHYPTDGHSPLTWPCQSCYQTTDTCGLFQFLFWARHPGCSQDTRPCSSVPGRTCTPQHGMGSQVIFKRSKHGVELFSLGGRKGSSYFTWQWGFRSKRQELKSPWDQTGTKTGIGQGERPQKLATVVILDKHFSEPRN